MASSWQLEVKMKANIFETRKWICAKFLLNLAVWSSLYVKIRVYERSRIGKVAV
jgi:hypothetical protein